MEHEGVVQGPLQLPVLRPSHPKGAVWAELSAYVLDYVRIATLAEGTHDSPSGKTRSRPEVESCSMCRWRSERSAYIARNDSTEKFKIFKVTYNDTAETVRIAALIWCQHGDSDPHDEAGHAGE